MKVRTTIAGKTLGMRLTGFVVLTILTSATVSACTGGGSSSTAPTIFTPSPSGSAPLSASPSYTASVGTPGTTPSASPSPSPSASPSAAPSTSATFTPTEQPTPSPSSSSASPFPSAPPAAGGGGTAGFQNALLLGLGLGAILLGAGSLAYRRRIGRNR